MLSKALEAAIAERISYLAEEHSLLPKNHFGARKRRDTMQALELLQEKIYEAWHHRKVLSLVSFDVKGAYNGVSRKVLLQRLHAQRIPEELVQWVSSFCSNRRVSITVNGQDSAEIVLPQAGLPQGSPLSPILFLFFNADLVQSVINTHKGSIAFIDDFTTWVTGDSADDNTRKLQSTVIPKIERWEIESGATFQADKTAFIHFTRNPAHVSRNPLTVKMEDILPKTKVKILGVIMDNQLKFHHHAARAVNRGFRTALALKRLRGLRPSTA